jgi:hypothetical protein
MRTAIGSVISFGGQTRLECGDKWWTWYRWIPEKYRTPLSVVFAFVATHNHFVLDRGGKVFNRSAPVIKLPADASEDDHLGLLGLLNSSTACFWMKQVFYPKGGDHVGQEGARVRRTLWDERYEFAGTGLGMFPLPETRPTELARLLDQAARRFNERRPAVVAKRASEVDLALWEARKDPMSQPGQMIALQEELDWECYALYGLIDEELCCSGHTVSPIQLGQRAFEIVMARKMARGELETTWFARHGSTPITELPADWDPAYRRIVERRIEAIETNPQIALIEQPEYKRRWNTEPWESQLERALREWLLDRLESYFDFDGRMNDAAQPTAKVELGLVSVARLADIARQDADFMQVAQLYRDDPAFGVQQLVAELVEAESVPLLPLLRYKPAGLRKRAAWEKTWELQRQEDTLGQPLAELQAGLAATQLAATQLAATQLAAMQQQHGAKLPQDIHQLLQRIEHDIRVQEQKCREFAAAIPVPPKYTSADFLNSGYWRLRGKLDVPKERWASLPHCEGNDGTLVIAWAGYDHLQLARAVSAHYMDVQERLGGRGDPRLVPLLGCLVELLPWIKQWHNEPDAAFDGMRMGDYFDGFISEEARQLGKTIEEIQAWVPPPRTGGRGRSRA